MDFGPEHAIAISPFCTVEDVQSWACSSKSIYPLLKTRVVWEDMIVAHFARAFACLKELQEGEQAVEKGLMKLDADSLRKVYASLVRSSGNAPFELDSRARLIFEIYELRAWDVNLKQFCQQRQTACLADAVANSKASEHLRTQMALPALELLALHTILGKGKVFGIEDVVDVTWSQTASHDLARLVDRRWRERRTWWHKQRQFLLQSASMDSCSS